MIDVIAASALRLAIMFGIVYTCLGWVCAAVVLHKSFKERNDHHIVYAPIECPMCQGEGVYADDLCSLCDGETHILSQISGPSTD